METDEISWNNQWQPITSLQATPSQRRRLTSSQSHYKWHAMPHRRPLSWPSHRREWHSELRPFCITYTSANWQFALTYFFAPTISLILEAYSIMVTFCCTAPQAIKDSSTAMAQWSGTHWTTESSQLWAWCLWSHYKGLPWLWITGLFPRCQAWLG